MRQGKSRVMDVTEERSCVRAATGHAGADQTITIADLRRRRGMASNASITLLRIAEASTRRQMVATVREILDFEVAYIARRWTEDDILCDVTGDAASFGLFEGMRLPRLTGLARDVAAAATLVDIHAEPEAVPPAVREQVSHGSFLTIPLRFSDGFPYGTFCAASHRPRPALAGEEPSFLQLCGQLLRDRFEREHLLQVARDADGQDAALGLLLGALEAHGRTGSSTVVTLAVAVAEHLGLSQNETSDVRLVAMLHGLRTLDVSDVLCHMPSLRRLVPAIRATHEWWDGTGHPDALAETDIPLSSRITSVCAAYCAMRGNRSHRPALDVASATHELRQRIGSQFCPTAATALLAVLNADRARPEERPQARLLGPHVGTHGAASATARAARLQQRRCQCRQCGAHAVADVGLRVAGQCPNCRSYDLAPADEPA